MIHPLGAHRAAIPQNAIPSLPAEDQQSNQRAIATLADFKPLTELILILSQGMLMYNRVEYGMFRLYSLSGAHWAAIPMSTFSIVSSCKLVQIVRRQATT